MHTNRRKQKWYSLAIVQLNMHIASESHIASRQKNRCTACEFVCW